MESSYKPTPKAEADILFSRTVKAGKRIYYIDVKQNSRGEMYLSITESKKLQTGTQEMPHVSYEKHKIFLFREDFAKFGEALGDAIGFINEGQGVADERSDESGAIKLDLEF